MSGPILADIGTGGGWSGTKATKAGDGVQDKRTSYDRKFDEEQAMWQDNEDRNDDALYHRSFDDGSMHLVSTKFRDGKPVDNHGKEIGGMGAAPVNKYRRHDTQGATSVGETAYAPHPLTIERQINQMQDVGLTDSLSCLVRHYQDIRATRRRQRGSALLRRHNHKGARTWLDWPKGGCPMGPQPISGGALRSSRAEDRDE